VQVFISHSSKDKPAVEALALALRDYRTAKDSIAVSFIPPSVLSPLRSQRPALRPLPGGYDSVNGRI